MNTYTNKHNTPYAPTDTADFYPDTDGQPMAASDSMMLKHFIYLHH